MIPRILVDYTPSCQPRRQPTGKSHTGPSWRYQISEISDIRDIRYQRYQLPSPVSQSAGDIRSVTFPGQLEISGQLPSLVSWRYQVRYLPQSAGDIRSVPFPSQLGISGEVPALVWQSGSQSTSQLETVLSQWYLYVDDQRRLHVPIQKMSLRFHRQNVQMS